MHFVRAAKIGIALEMGGGGVGGGGGGRGGLGTSINLPGYLCFIEKYLNLLRGKVYW